MDAAYPNDNTCDNLSSLYGDIKHIRLINKP